MNEWTQRSIDLANQRSYLDLLYQVYPTVPNDCRTINPEVWEKIENAFHQHENLHLIQHLLKLERFPIQDAYVSFLRKDPTALQRNPETVNRLAERVVKLGLSKIYELCSEPKETNRQMGNAFRDWIAKGALGVQLLPEADFLRTNANAVLCGSDAELMFLAHTRFGYDRNKGLDLVARFNGKYVIGEAKFLTETGGHQNAQFEDAMLTLHTDCNAVKIAILDGICYLKKSGKMLKRIVSETGYIMSALVLREFLCQL